MQASGSKQHRPSRPIDVAVDTEMKRASPSSGFAPSSVGSSKAGNNWKALKKTLDSDAHSTSRKGNSVKAKARTKSLAHQAAATPVAPAASAAAAASRKAPTVLPWFAEDISAQDLELVRQSETDRQTAQTLQWEGIADPVAKAMAILSGVPESAPISKQQAGNYLAVDCEMVGVGHKGSESVLARVSIVNYHGATILDRFVKPQEKVTDYRTWVSGVRARDLKDASSFAEVQAEVAALIQGKVLVGHAINNDLKALLLDHPRVLIRDTATFQPLREIAKTKYPSLKKLAKLVLDIDIQQDGKAHSSVEDARATMAVFRSQKTQWDQLLRSKPGGAGVPKSSASSSARVWQAPADGNAVNAASPALTARSRSQPAADKAPAPQARLKPKMPAQADWWKDSV